MRYLGYIDWAIAQTGHPCLQTAMLQAVVAGTIPVTFFENPTKVGWLTKPVVIGNRLNGSISIDQIMTGLRQLLLQDVLPYRQSFLLGKNPVQMSTG